MDGALCSSMVNSSKMSLEQMSSVSAEKVIMPADDLHDDTPERIRIDDPYDRRRALQKQLVIVARIGAVEMDPAGGPRLGGRRAVVIMLQTVDEQCVSGRERKLLPLVDQHALARKRQQYQKRIEVFSFGVVFGVTFEKPRFLNVKEGGAGSGAWVGMDPYGIVVDIAIVFF